MVRSPLPWVALTSTLLVPALVFALLFSYDATDDYAGWALALAGLGLPTSLVILRDRDPISGLGLCSLVVPAAAALGAVSGAAVFLIPLPEVFKLALLMAAAPMMTVVVAVALFVKLRGQRTRDATRRVFAVVALPAAVATAVLARAWWGVWASEGFERDLQIAALLLGTVPLLWPLGPAVVWGACAVARRRSPTGG